MAVAPISPSGYDIPSTIDLFKTRRDNAKPIGKRDAKQVICRRFFVKYDKMSEKAQALVLGTAAWTVTI